MIRERITLQAVAENGDLLAPDAVVNLAAGEALQKDADQLFSFPEASPLAASGLALKPDQSATPRQVRAVGSLRVSADGGPGERTSKLLTELMPSTSNQSGGYVVVTASQGIVAQQLFGTASLLSAVPPTVIR